MGRPAAPSDIAALALRTEEFRVWLSEARSRIDGINWYLYDILGNLGALGALLGPGRDLASLSGGLPVADIGAADGDLSFVLERELGWQMDIIDNAPTNMNGLRAARALAEHLGSRVEIHDVDLDTQFTLPRARYGLVLLLGILYHLQNPYYVLRELAQRTDYLALSTRVARFAGPQRTAIADLPVAYLVGPQETNHDATNYWMFSPAGLERIVTRAGWTTVSSFSGGDTVNSDPSSAEHDERQFMLLRSTHGQR
jgi:2-polyprenyl-3-methyl-5-hydroxy-6-metoxy-1,4-benzoquinol methylase